MDEDTPAVGSLELVVDDFEEGQHEKLDFDIPQLLSVNLNHMTLILLGIVEQLGDRGHPRYRGSISKCRTLCRTLIDNNPGIFDMICAGSKEGYKSVRLLSKGLSASADGMSNATFNPCVIEILRKEDKPPQQVQCGYAERTGSESRLFLILRCVSDVMLPIPVRG